MLKRIIIGLAVVIILALGAGGVYAYRLYSAVNNLGRDTLPKICPTPATFVPQLLPGNHFSSSQASIVAPKAAATQSVGGLNIPCEQQIATDPPTLTGKKRINILVLGSDNDSKFASSILSQTIMVVTIDPVHKKVSFFSIPRDSWVYVPGISYYGDLASYHKIDEAMSYGEQASTSNNAETRFKSGVEYAKLTVEANFGIHIDYYAWVGLMGFVNVINTLGGVDVNAMHPIVDDNYPGDLSGNNPYAYTRVYIPAGPQFMNGSAGLEYARSRHADLNGDFGRGARQEQVLIALRRKLDALGITDIVTISNLISELQGFVQSDVGGQVLAMADFARGMKLSNIHRVVLTPPYYSGGGTSPDGTQSVVYLNWAHVMPVVHRLFAPIKLHGHRTTSPPPVVTAALALKLLVRVAGAAPAGPPKHVLQLPLGPMSGRLYFVGGDGNVWSFDSSGAHRVTHTTAIDGAYVTPNGRKLVYYRRWVDTVSDVWLQNLRTGGVQQITHDRATDGVVQDNLWAVNPVISPDGKTIIYESDAYKLLASPAVFSNPDCATAPANGGIDLALYSYDVATGTSNQLTAPCWGAGGDADPRFDPTNPNRIVYTEFYYLPNSSIASRLVVMNIVTGARYDISPFRGRNMQPAWQANGHHLAWLGSSDQSTTLYEAAFYNGVLHRGTTRRVDSGLISQPVFSTDGKHLAYFKLVSNNFQIWAVNLKKGWPVGKPEQLLSRPNMVASSPLVWTR